MVHLHQAAVPRDDTIWFNIQWNNKHTQSLKCIVASVFCKIFQFN